MFDRLQLGRRMLLKAIVCTIPTFIAFPLKSIAAQGGDNPIAKENRKRGTTDWFINYPADNREIEGYASSTYINQGDSIQIFTNTADPSYKLEVFRLGWYGGTGGRSMFGPIKLSGTRQVIPQSDPETGLIECSWENPFTLRTSEDWTTGVYLIKLTASASNKESYITFTLRDNDSHAQLLFQSSVTTYQAYNNWGGKSLYDFNSTDNIAAIKVSFNRPYASTTDVVPYSSPFQWELSLLRFLEREAYDVAYCTNMTTHGGASLLCNHKAFLSVGHDEYWSSEIRQAVTTLRDQGVHLGFFGANSCYWQIRMEPSPITNQPCRTMVCYKYRFKEDPLFGVDNSRVATLWRSDVVNQPEEQLIGVQYVYNPVNTDLVVSNAKHWIFDGTGLDDSDHLPGLLGYEADRSFGRGPTNLIPLCHSPMITSVNKGMEFSEMTIYTASSGALVFAAGSMQFNWGLDDGADPSRTYLMKPAAQRMVRNLLKRFQ